MFYIKDTICRTLAGCLTSALLAGCSGAVASLPKPQTVTAPSSQGQTVPSSRRGRCAAFGATFDVVVACRRADGTLHAFTDPQITWRVRYFVRYLEMPCGEAPTVEESYVFHAVAGDLNGDADITAAQRDEIRTAMFSGKAPCT